MYYVAPETPMMSSVIADCPDLAPPQYFGQVYAYGRQCVLLYLCYNSGLPCLAVDVTTYYRGFHGDLNETFFVGNVDEKAKTLVRVTHECLDKAIQAGLYRSFSSDVYRVL